MQNVADPGKKPCTKPKDQNVIFLPSSLSQPGVTWLSFKEHEIGLIVGGKVFVWGALQYRSNGDSYVLSCDMLAKGRDMNRDNTRRNFHPPKMPAALNDVIMLWMSHHLGILGRCPRACAAGACATCRSEPTHHLLPCWVSSNKGDKSITAEKLYFCAWQTHVVLVSQSYLKIWVKQQRGISEHGL